MRSQNMNKTLDIILLHYYSTTTTSTTYYKYMYNT